MKDLNERGIENQTKGTAKEVKGNIRKNVGDAFDNESEQMKGSAEELEGKAQKTFGKAGHKLDPDNRGSWRLSNKKGPAPAGPFFVAALTCVDHLFLDRPSRCIRSNFACCSGVRSALSSR
ncbi:MAG: CsbD family protein [Gemmatimonadaceae bacterium]